MGGRAVSQRVDLRDILPYRPSRHADVRILAKAGLFEMRRYGGYGRLLATKQSDNQTREQARLGVFGDWFRCKLPFLSLPGRLCALPACLWEAFESLRQETESK